jgi:hypothetical protein
MEQVERYFHIRPHRERTASEGRYADHLRQRPQGAAIAETKGGATVRVVGNEHGITIQVAYCSANDAFCRKTGREVAATHPLLPFALNKLPEVLQNTARVVTGRVLKLSHSKRKTHHLWDTDFTFSTKYFVEKVV